MSYYSEGVVYLLHIPELRKVKVGFSINLEERLASLNRDLPTTIELVAYFPGTRRDEREILQLFKDYVFKGEWFYDSILQDARRAYHVRALRETRAVA